MAKKKTEKEYSPIGNYHHRPVRMNIGIVIFALVLVYFAINIITYSTKNHISGYEVTVGQISESGNFNGLILREEQIVNAPKDGKVNFYKKEGDRIAQNENLCSIDTSGELASKITAAGKDISGLGEEDLKNIRSMISQYSEEYTDSGFYNTYAFKNDVNAMIREDLYTNALREYNEEMEYAQGKNTFSFVSSESYGTLSLYTDGYESITVDNFKKENYDPSAYKKTDLKDLTDAKKSSPLYKLVKSEIWYILCPLRNEKEEELYADRDVISVTFLKDSESCYANCEIRDYDGQKFLVLKLNNSMVRYLSGRYMDVALNLDQQSGLKIPNSSITKKEFYLIPKDFVTRGDDSGSDGVLRIPSGKSTPVFTPLTLYAEQEDYYCVDMEQLSSGDVLQMPESDRQFTVDKTVSLEGVYNINKGYTIFKVIDSLASNKEYTIIATGTDYGVSLYDHIALNAEELTEGEILT